MSSRYDRQEKIKGWKQDRLNKTVAVVGLGALGTHIVGGLLGLGIQNIIGVDFDTIEIHNLNRQVLYLEKDIDRLKCDAMSDRVKERNSEIVFTALNEKITEDNIDLILDGVDVIVGALDNIHGRLVLSDFVIENDLIGVHVGTSVFGGEVCMYSRKTPCLRCFLKEPDDEVANRCTREVDPAIVDTNMIISGIAVAQVRYALLPLEGHRSIPPILYYNATRYSLIPIKDNGKIVSEEKQPEPFWYMEIKKNPTCACSKYG